jgi:hypothetical protein
LLSLLFFFHTPFASVFILQMVSTLYKHQTSGSGEDSLYDVDSTVAAGSEFALLNHGACRGRVKSALGMMTSTHAAGEGSCHRVNDVPLITQRA